MTILGPLSGILDSSSPVSVGVASGAADSAAGVVLRGMSSWVLTGTRGAIEEVASAIGTATAPNLNSTWFSSTYWRVAALAAMLTIPFLCAAAVQAVAHGDLSLLARVAFGYLPLSLLGVSLAAPLTMLLLAATDQMTAAVSASGVTGGARFLDEAATAAGGLATATGGSPFFAVVVGLLALLAAMALAVELLVRAAAVYIVVLMLPLAFAALVWPARRIWAARLVELLASLIISKFVIVAVLSLAGAAFASGTAGIGELLVAMSLILLSTFAPWALMRILPFTELAAGAAGVLRNELPQAPGRLESTDKALDGAALAAELPGRLREHARSMYARSGGEAEPATAAAATPGDEEPADGFATTAAVGGSGVTQPPAPPASPSQSEGADQSPSSDHNPSPDDGTPSDQGPSSDDGTPSDHGTPFVLPSAWSGSERARLDEGRLRPPASDDRPAADRPTPDQPAAGQPEEPR